MALVLSRKPGESIDIGNATVEIISVAGNRVRLAIQAPPDVRVLRSELAGKDSSDGETSESGDPGTGRLFRASAGSGDRGNGLGGGWEQYAKADPGTGDVGDGFGELDGDLCDE